MPSSSVGVGSLPIVKGSMKFEDHLLYSLMGLVVSEDFIQNK